MKITSKLHRKRTPEAGLPPGILIFQGQQKVASITLTVCEYTERTCQENKVAKIEDCFPLKDKTAVNWINIIGIHDPAIIEKLMAALKHIEQFFPFMLENPRLLEAVR